MSRMFRSALALGMLATSLAACSGDPTGTDETQLEGEYFLFSINGQPLPFTISLTATTRTEITQGTLSLNADRTFVDVTDLRITQSGVVTTDEDLAQGNWAAVGSTVSFTPDDGSGTYTMAWNGDLRLTQLFQNLTLVYEQEPPLVTRR